MLPLVAIKMRPGGEIVSVSAASSAFSAQIGKQFKRVAGTLTAADTLTIG